MKEILYTQIEPNTLYYLTFIKKVGFKDTFVKLASHENVYNKSEGCLDAMKSKIRFYEYSKEQKKWPYAVISHYDFKIGQCNIYEIEHKDEITILEIK